MKPPGERDTHLQSAARTDAVQSLRKGDALDYYFSRNYQLT